ncbi:MAG: CBS domain-containing protein [Candidatus Aquicultor sp.]
MNVSDIMTKNPESAQVTDSIMDVASMMRDINVGFMPILDGNILVGVSTDRDIVIRAVADGMDIENTSIGEIMSSDLHVVSPDTSLDEAANIMEEFKIRRLPVVDQDGLLVGVISLGDIAVRGQNIEEAGEVLEQVSEPSRPEMAA